MKEISIQVIGIVKNPFDEFTPRETFEESESEIILDPELEAGLDGLEPGSQIYILFYLHRSHGYELHQHPRGDQTRPKRGVFSLRTPRRPNPIGLTEVELLSIEGHRLRVRGLDAINGTPVLDIKPAWNL
jgi:tRNA-Thr(GGU) m(6)t(6)A37 methyltransferase TsaA